MRWLRWFVPAVALMVGFAGTTAGADLTYKQVPLVGLGEIDVVIEEIDDPGKEAGLNERTLQTDVELRLRKAGIRVGDGLPYLYVLVHVMKTSRCGFAFSVSVELRDRVQLVRDPSVEVNSTIWVSGGLGKTPEDGAERNIRGAMGDNLDDFINDYLAANPKER